MLPPLNQHQRRDKGRLRAVGVLAAALALVVVVILGVAHSGAPTHGHLKRDDGELKEARGKAPSGNCDDIAPIVPRAFVLGDAGRYLLSNRRFNIREKPQTRNYHWTVSEVRSTPGGVLRPLVVVNGQSPGPILEANLGDEVVIHLTNALANSTTIHWHGMLQNGTIFMDGADAITQCAIPPGGKMIYRWKAQNVGTYWWHGHTNEQYTDGLFGPLIIHSPTETAMVKNRYDDEYTFIFNDAYNTMATVLMPRFMQAFTGINGNPGDEPSPDGNMINGVSNARCAYLPSNQHHMDNKRDDMGMPAAVGSVYNETNVCGKAPLGRLNVNLAAGKTYRLRLINAGTLATSIFSIDNHELTVIEVDGVSVEPFKTWSVEVASAQRFSVLVTLNKPPGAYWIRTAIVTEDLKYTGPNFNSTVLSVLRYGKYFTNPVDAPIPDKWDSLPEAGSEAVFVPADKLDAPPPTRVEYLTFQGAADPDTNMMLMYFNNTSYRPLPAGQSSLNAIRSLPDAIVHNSTALEQEPGLGHQVSFVNQDASGVFDLVFNSLDDGPHPFHLHGHTFWVMSVGPGAFTGPTDGLSPINPMRRDTVIIPSNGHLVMRIRTDNPGVWTLHCHIGWHMATGLLLTITNQPGVIKSLAIPPDVARLCKA